jgi:very-short-patch-repair endonuclease
MRDNGLTQRAREMRTASSEPEQRMWIALRAKRFAHVKFRRQKVIGPYIVDFAARDPMLVVEIDGDTHDGRVVYDAARTAYLEQQGYVVVRFSNIDVMANLEGVPETLAEHIERLSLPHPTPPLPTLSPEGARAL